MRGRRRRPRAGAAASTRSRARTARTRRAHRTSTASKRRRRDARATNGRFRGRRGSRVEISRNSGRITHSGGRYLYGPWHLIVAGYVALAAAGRPASTDAWLRTVEDEVFRPAGVKATPEYPGLQSDSPYFFPWWGAAYSEQDFRFPDLAGGMRMSGRQYGRRSQNLSLKPPISLRLASFGLIL